MQSLRQDLDQLLDSLNRYRNRAVALRDKGYLGLVALANLDMEKGRRLARVTPRQVAPPDKQPDSLDKWLGMGNKIEAALLLRVQRDRRLRREVAGEFPPPDAKLERKIRDIKIEDLLPFDDEGNESGENEYHANAMLDRRIPVLIAANAMLVLTGHSSTTLSQQTMYCYYAILHELSLAARPDWQIGAGRAGDGGNVSAFVTGECMRAISSLERAHRRTADFMRHTRELNEKYLVLCDVVKSIGGPLPADHPLQLWIEKVTERIWLDWYSSVDAQRGELCLEVPDVARDRPMFIAVGEYLEALPRELRDRIKKIAEELNYAEANIVAHAGKEGAHQTGSAGRRVRQSAAHAPRNPKPMSNAKERARLFAHESALLVVHDAMNQGDRLAKTLDGYLQASPQPYDHVQLLKTVEQLFTRIAVSIRRVLGPSRHYMEGALDRALAESETQLDAGELAFAARAYGAATQWQSSSRHRLWRACDLLLKSVPENGMLATRHPFHSTPRGYKLFPTSCEMMASLAVLVQRTSFELDASAIESIGRLLDAVEDKKIDLDDQRWYGWNFEGATEQEKPSVWVSCVTVLALDRLVQMLDRCINDTILRHFDVIQPRKPHSEITLNDLIYPDYGFALECPTFGRDLRQKRTPIAITLQEMRAHLTGVSLPDRQSRSRVFSAVLYGPPQTGKTTFAEALARSSEVPVVRLSSFDLTQDPEESIESRARVIFDALAMLTRTVILFDEFESVLQERDEKHELTIEFLLTGLLPKLVKLHNVAGSQRLAYFLATNHIERIDSAAIRRGRFDLQVPVYNPDALSRTAACLYRLQLFRNRAKSWRGAQPKWTDPAWSFDAPAVIRLLNVVKETIGVAPRELAETFFRLPGNKAYEFGQPHWVLDFPYIAHVLEGHPLPPLRPRPANGDKGDEPVPPGASDEAREKNWLARFEQSFDDRLTEEMKQLAGKGDHGVPAASPAAILDACLRAPAGTTQ